VSIASTESGGSTVNVTYQLTALSPVGNESLKESFSKPSYAAMMEDWRAMIIDSREKVDKHFGR